MYGCLGKRGYPSVLSANDLLPPGPLQSSTPYTASLYKNDPIVTVHNVSSVDGNGFNLVEQEGEGQGEGEWEMERVRTTSDTFKLGWLKDPVEQDTQDM